MSAITEDYGAFDENDIEDFEDYLHYYGFDDDGGDEDEDELKELYF